MLAEEYKAFLSENAASRDEQPNIYHAHEDIRARILPIVHPLPPATVCNGNK
jgi:hypothetical protein